jgi:hypothetical protein
MLTSAERSSLIEAFIPLELYQDVVPEMCAVDLVGGMGLLGAISQGVEYVFGQRGTNVGQPLSRYQSSCGMSSLWRHSGADEVPMHRPLDPPITTMGPSERMSDARRYGAASPDDALTGPSHEHTMGFGDTRITMIRRPAWGDVINRSFLGGRLILRCLTHQVTRARDRHAPTIRVSASPAPQSSA